jgi:hypothetical protein
MLIIIFLENVHYHLFQTTYLPVTNVETYYFRTHSLIWQTVLFYFSVNLDPSPYNHRMPNLQEQTPVMPLFEKPLDQKFRTNNCYILLCFIVSTPTNTLPTRFFMSCKNRISQRAPYLAKSATIPLTEYSVSNQMKHMCSMTNLQLSELHSKYVVLHNAFNICKH